MTEASTMNFRKLHPEATFPALDSWEIGVPVRACLISETGRPNKCLIPPQSTRSVSTGLAIEIQGGASLIAYTPIDLALKSIFVIPRIMNIDINLIILLYNGSHQSYYINHEDIIARLVLVASMYMKVGEMQP